MKSSSTNQNGDILNLSSNFESIENFKYKNLYDYQKTGFNWLLNLFNTSTGGILADDMGLGKTAQTCVFLHYIFSSDLIKHCLIILPKSLMLNWVQELNYWCPGVEFQFFKSGDSSRLDKLSKIQNSRGILITTYGVAAREFTTLSQTKTKNLFKWNILILDEAHKIKGTTLCSKNIRLINTGFRLALSGTPLQNNLMELWNLVNFISFGKLLGERNRFKREFADVIEYGLKKAVDENSAFSARQKMARVIKTVLPYILRRTKLDQTKNLAKKGIIFLPPKSEFVLWIPMSDYQLFIYRKFIESDTFKQALFELLRNHRSQALVMITILRLLSNHPVLIKNWRVIRRELDKAEAEWKKNNRQISDDKLEKSSKIVILNTMVKRLIQENCKILIFSQSKSMLDVIAVMLDKNKFKYLKLNGTITSVSNRQRIIDSFQKDTSMRILLITTQTGGVGLNLTSANRVIIIEPTWNPGNDSQAIDRAHRIGQTQEVIVYRLITCGTVEEKIYRRQIFKNELVKFAVNETKNPTKYFTHNELKDLMTLSSTNKSQTCEMINKMHASPLKNHPEAPKLLKEGIKSISDHNIILKSDNQEKEDENIFTYDGDDSLHQETEISFKTDKKLTKNEPITDEFNVQNYIDEIMADFNVVKKKESDSDLESYKDGDFEEISFIDDQDSVDLKTITDEDDIELIENKFSEKEKFKDNHNPIERENIDDKYMNSFDLIDDKYGYYCDHFNMAEVNGYTVTRCRCDPSLSELTEYQRLIIEARASRTDKIKHLNLLLDALDIYDDDFDIQLEARILAVELGIENDEEPLPDYLE